MNTDSNDKKIFFSETVLTSKTKNSAEKIILGLVNTIAGTESSECFSSYFDQPIEIALDINVAATDYLSFGEKITYALITSIIRSGQKIPIISDMASMLGMSRQQLSAYLASMRVKKVIVSNYMLMDGIMKPRNDYTILKENFTLNEGNEEK